jgi:spore coat protein U-like protein
MPSSRGSVAVAVAVAAFLAAVETRAAGTCTISSTPLAFGLYNALSTAPTDSAGVITFDCTVNVAPQITIGPGGAGSYNPRLMSSAGNALAYNVYADPARTVVWDGTPITVPATGCTGQCGNGTQVSFYGRIFPLQDVAAGAYFDNLVVTIFF